MDKAFVMVILKQADVSLTWKTYRFDFAVPLPALALVLRYLLRGLAAGPEELLTERYVPFDMRQHKNTTNKQLYLNNSNSQHPH